MKKKVLFICTHNSARSQMAEGLLRALYGDYYEAYSAGTQATRVNPYAIKVMTEIGIDISKQRSKSIEEFRGKEFDYVVTVCDHAKETCPFFPGANFYLHKGFKDPSEATGDEESILREFRRVREEIKAWIEETFGSSFDSLKDDENLLNPF
ncbi:MAG: arsenate reductase ArsC [Caldisericaceae bacterium]